MNLKKFFLAVTALFLGVISVQSQIYPPGVNIRIFQPEKGGHIELINNLTQQEILTYEIIINQGFDNEERYFLATIPPFTQVRVKVMLESEDFFVKGILLNENPLSLDEPVFQGWRDGELYDLTALISKKTSTSTEQFTDSGIRAFYDQSSKSVKLVFPETFIGQKAELFSALGQKVSEQIIHSTKTTVPAPQSIGIYIVRIGNFSKKIIINH